MGCDGDSHFLIIQSLLWASEEDGKTEVGKETAFIMDTDNQDDLGQWSLVFE